MLSVLGRKREVLRQSEIHRDICLGFDGYSVPQVGFVPPLSDRLDSGLAQKQGAVHQFQISDAAIRANPCLQNNGALETSFQSLLGIARGYFLEK